MIELIVWILAGLISTPIFITRIGKLTNSTVFNDMQGDEKAGMLIFGAVCSPIVTVLLMLVLVYELVLYLSEKFL